jgi:ketosteroid isomerase-like protein
MNGFSAELMAVANKLVENCRTGQEAAGLDALYHPDAVSVEAMAMPGQETGAVTGIAAIKAKHDWWYGAFEMHSTTAEGPFLHGADRFAVIFGMDTTERATGTRMQMREVAIYTVAAGKITREEFFYSLP